MFVSSYFNFLASKYCKYLVVSSVMIWVGLKLSIIQTIGCHLMATPCVQKRFPSNVTTSKITSLQHATENDKHSTFWKDKKKLSFPII